jgi:catechol 2,3-dioxygenase-like lactoylglutathione lyase family enzyme
MTNSSDHTGITDIRTVGVPVSDQARSLEFYIEKLGFEKRLDTPFGDGRWLEVAPRGATTSIALVSVTHGASIGVDTAFASAPSTRSPTTLPCSPRALTRTVRSCGRATPCRQCSRSVIPTETAS